MPLREEDIAEHLALAHAPEPDLFIRTGGETRISNFLLWQLAYTELWFTETLWPDFGATDVQAAVDAFRNRERRFGRTSDQIRREAGHAGAASPDVAPDSDERAGLPTIAGSR